MKCLGSFEVPISEIDPGHRLRNPDPYHVEGLIADMKERGQLQAIIVVKISNNEFLLAVGMHRLVSMSEVSDTIRAEVWDPQKQDPKEVARILEIDETILQNTLNPLERGVFLASRKALYEKMFPETKAGVAGGKSRQGSASGMFTFAEQTAEKIGLSRSTVEQACRIGNMPEGIRKRIVGTPLAEKGVELLNLARLEPDQQSKALDLMLAEKSSASSVAAAVKIIEGHIEQSSPEDKQFQKLLDAWGRASPKVKTRFLGQLRQDGVLVEGK